MSKPKQYDREDLLNRAIEVFRSQGYNGTSITDLTSELEVNKKSLYSEFGSKQGLFEASLAYYNDHHLANVLSPLESPEADIETIKNAFREYASAIDGSYKGLGCLLCNSAVERGALESASGAYIDNYFQRIFLAFRNALSNRLSEKDLNGRIKNEEYARYLTTIMIGMSASIRAEAPADQLWSTYKIVKVLLDQIEA